MFLEFAYVSHNLGTRVRDEMGMYAEPCGVGNTPEYIHTLHVRV